MPRIDIELTSSRPDGTWTWRAAGARQPKGSLEGALLYEGAKVGDVVRADCEVDLDGTRVTAVLPPRAKSPPERLAVLGSGRDGPLVTQDGGEPDLRERPRREGRSDGRRGGERDGGPRSGVRPGGGRSPGRPPGDRPSRPTAERGPRSSTGRGAGPEGGRERPAPAGGGREGQARARPDRARAAAPRRPRAEAPSPEPRHRPKRLQPGRAHRDAVLAELPPEQRPVADQVLRGGLSAVRQAVEEQNARARSAGAPEVRADALVALAEGLLPRLRAAEWRDRAEAAAASVDDIGLRDLRAVVAGADAAGRDDESRALALGLREALERRGAAERESWGDEIRRSLAEGRVVRALRVSGRPPEPGVRFPPDLAQALSTAAGGAMTAETAPDRWAALLDAVVASPVRRTVQPQGLPAERDADFERALRLAAPRVPAVAALLGGPRPPGPRAARPPRPPASPGPRAGGPRRPPPPPHAAPSPPPPGPVAATPSSQPPAEPEGPAQPLAAASGDDGDDPVLVEELG